MATLMIPGLDDGTYERLRAHAEANGRTVEDEVREMIAERYKSRAAWAAELKVLREELREKYGALPDSLSLIRQIRDEE